MRNELNDPYGGVAARGYGDHVGSEAGPAADGGHLGPCVAVGARFSLAGRLLFPWQFGAIGFVSSFSVGEAWDRTPEGLRDNHGKGRCGARSELAAAIFVSDRCNRGSRAGPGLERRKAADLKIEICATSNVIHQVKDRGTYYQL